MLKSKSIFITTSFIVISAALAINVFAQYKAYYLVEKDQLQSNKYEQVVKIITRNQQDKLQQLLNNGFDINTQIKGDGTLLIIAIQHHQNHIARQLITMGADIDLSAPQDGNPLINAAIHNNLDMAKVLLNHGANIDAIVEHDETALISASRAGHTEMVKLLVERGADVNLGVNTKSVRGTEYRTPLNGAKNDKITRLLKMHGAKA